MCLIVHLLLLTLLWLCYFNHEVKCEDNFDPSICSNVLSSELINEIDNYIPVINQIINAATNSSFSGQTWLELAHFIDKAGSRFTGSQNLEKSIDYMLEKSKKLDLENVRGETVPVPRWVRGHESAKLLKPYEKNLKILGSGGSVGTPREGITAEAIVVNNFEELEKRAKEVPGKIVIYNHVFDTYEKSIIYRFVGAQRAAALGAVAALLRSITPLSSYTPHTGVVYYKENITKIPSASITVKDADYFKQMDEWKVIIIIKLVMEEHQLPDGESRNGIAEIIGSSKPEKVVVVSAHIDNWDIGQGVIDDAAGLFTTWSSLVLLKSLNLRPKRTIRAIMWTAEEMGLFGSKHYIQQHKDEEKDLQFVMETDTGTFLPLGWEATASPIVLCILERITKMMSSMTPLGVRTPFRAPNIKWWVNVGVPGATLWNQNDRYFWYHHTENDTLGVVDSNNLDMITAMFAATTYVIADISLDFPRNN